MNNWEEYLRKTYYDPRHPASYVGLQNLYDKVKREGKYKIVTVTRNA